MQLCSGGGDLLDPDIVFAWLYIYVFVFCDREMLVICVSLAELRIHNLKVN